MRIILINQTPRITGLAAKKKGQEKYVYIQHVVFAVPGPRSTVPDRLVRRLEALALVRLKRTTVHGPRSTGL